MLAESECVPQSGDGAGTRRDASLTGCKRKIHLGQAKAKGTLHPDRGEDRARFGSNRVDTGHCGQPGRDLLVEQGVSSCAAKAGMNLRLGELVFGREMVG
jgi:hypothetical protein